MSVKELELMRMAWPVCLLIATITAAASSAESPVPEGAALEKLGQGYKWPEGPAVSPAGVVYFSDTADAIIYRFDQQQEKVVVAERDTGGANGLMFDQAGRLYRCEGSDHTLTRGQPKSGQIKTLVDQYQGHGLNGPNDLVLDQHGGVYFTDPRYGNRDNQPMDTEAVYYWHPESGCQRVIDSLTRPNGIGLSPDGETLYVADAPKGLIVAFDVTGPGEVTNKRNFARLSGDDPTADGMTIDQKGRVYQAGTGGVSVFDSTGKPIVQIHTPQFAANCTLGENVLYITATDAFYRIPVKAKPLPLKAANTSD
jgi:gluconolactonase